MAWSVLEKSVRGLPSMGYKPELNMSSAEKL